MEWIKCSDRMPSIPDCNWRTDVPLLVNCEMGVIPAYFGFTWSGGAKHYGFMESIRFGDERGDGPVADGNGLMENVSEWSLMPPPPTE